MQLQCQDALYCKCLFDCACFSTWIFLLAVLPSFEVSHLINYFLFRSYFDILIGCRVFYQAYNLCHCCRINQIMHAIFFPSLKWGGLHFESKESKVLRPFLYLGLFLWIDINCGFLAIFVSCFSCGIHLTVIAYLVYSMLSCICLRTSRRVIF